MSALEFITSFNEDAMKTLSTFTNSKGGKVLNSVNDERSRRYAPANKKYKDYELFL